MSVGKYSPTVTKAYMEDSYWFDKYCEESGDHHDIEGYDRYGYNTKGVDRAGHTEDEYLSAYIDSIRNGDDENPDEDNSTPIYHLAEQVHDKWTFKLGRPAKIQ
jgi:hypothetical protein